MIPIDKPTALQRNLRLSRERYEKKFKSLTPLGIASNKECRISLLISINHFQNYYWSVGFLFSYSALPHYNLKIQWKEPA